MILMSEQMIKETKRAPWDAAAARAIIDANAQIRGATLVMMHALQDQFGYVHDEAIAMIADAQNLSRAEVRGVLTFYHDFRRHKPGEHVLKLCRAEACQARGAVALHEAAKRRLSLDWHGTTPDNRLTLEPVLCLGLCASGPAGMLDDTLLARLDERALDRVLAEVGR